MWLLHGTLRSAGARVQKEGNGNYKHLVPPGPKRIFEQHTITPLPALLRTKAPTSWRTPKRRPFGRSATIGQQCRFLQICGGALLKRGVSLCLPAPVCRLSRVCPPFVVAVTQQSGREFRSTLSLRRRCLKVISRRFGNGLITGATSWKDCSPTLPITRSRGGRNNF